MNDCATLLEFYEGHPERWCRGVLARNAHGDHVHINSPTAASFDLTGALARVYEDRPSKRLMVSNRIFATTHRAISVFNDDFGRTFDDILDVLRQARA